MITTIASFIWDCIQDKKITLLMIFNNKGEIMWQQGGGIKEWGIDKGNDLYRRYCLEILKRYPQNYENDYLINPKIKEFSESSFQRNIKKQVIFPVSEEQFCYMDSSENESFHEKEIIELKTLGRIFYLLIKKLNAIKSEAGEINGSSEAITKIKELVKKYAAVDDVVLLLGETGVGKNRVAELIHRYSGRKGPFVCVHTPGVAKDLFESQLFGHRKGSFTGALSDNTGYVSRAVGGTLFLDEIAELSAEIQAKLLRLIDNKSYTRLGDSIERKANVRIIAATNRDLKELVRERLFREDLYFRLNVLPIVIPSLRERPGDIPDLLVEFEKLLRQKRLSPAAKRILEKYSWPGNIREMRSVLTRAGIDCEGDEIGSEISDFLEKESVLSNFVSEKGMDDKLDKLWQELRDGKSFWDAVKNPFMKRNICREDVRMVVQRALKESNGKGYMKDCLPALNVSPSELKKFLDFLRDYHIF